MVFTGTEAALPPCPAPGRVRIGLYAGNIHTTRPAELVAFPSILSDGGTPAAPGVDVYAQLLALLEGDKVKGEKGDTGTTFTPSVSPDGTLSWTNDGGKENPESVNIKGADGAKGADGKKGEDRESITVESVTESVTESTEDGGSNVVIFSDGKSITIKNGSKGGTGPQGPAGSDATIPIATATVPGKVAPFPHHSGRYCGGVYAGFGVAAGANQRRGSGLHGGDPCTQRGGKDRRICYAYSRCSSWRGQCCGRNLSGVYYGGGRRRPG